MVRGQWNVVLWLIKISIHVLDIARIKTLVCLTKIIYFALIKTTLLTSRCKALLNQSPCLMSILAERLIYLVSNLLTYTGLDLNQIRQEDSCYY